MFFFQRPVFWHDNYLKNANVQSVSLIEMSRSERRLKLGVREDFFRYRYASESWSSATIYD